MSDETLAIAVAGGGSCSPETGRIAYETGAEIARRKATLVCGGRHGVMERAAAGAREAGGRTIGILPGVSSAESSPNDSIEIPVFTGLGQARNLIVVLSAQAVIAVDGKWGTLSEIALAIKHGVPVVLLGSWSILESEATREPLLETASTPGEAVDKAFAAITRSHLQ